MVKGEQPVASRYFVRIIVQELPIKPSNSSGHRVLLLLLPFNFFVIPFLVMLFRLGLFC